MYQFPNLITAGIQTKVNMTLTISTPKSTNMKSLLSLDSCLPTMMESCFLYAYIAHYKLLSYVPSPFVLKYKKKNRELMPTAAIKQYLML